MTNALGEVASYTYNSNKQLASIKFPMGLIASNIYSAYGFVMTTYQYATNQPPTNRVIEPTGGRVTNGMPGASTQ